MSNLIYLIDLAICVPVVLDEDYLFRSAVNFYFSSKHTNLFNDANFLTWIILQLCNWLIYLRSEGKH